MLVYKGNGFIPNVPARDLTDQEVAQYGKELLLASGLYDEVKAKRTRVEDKRLQPNYEDKEA